MEEATEGALRVWWIPQVPMDEFYVIVPDVEAAALIIDTLAQYDLFQYAHRIKPDYCNMGGLSIFQEGRWIDWEDRDTGEDFNEIRRDPEALASAFARSKSPTQEPSEANNLAGEN